MKEIKKAFCLSCGHEAENIISIVKIEDYFLWKMVLCKHCMTVSMFNADRLVFAAENGKILDEKDFELYPINDDLLNKLKSLRSGLEERSHVDNTVIFNEYREEMDKFKNNTNETRKLFDNLNLSVFKDE